MSRNLVELIRRHHAVDAPTALDVLKAAVEDHFPEARTNLLVGQSADVNTSCPEYKVVAVDVRPMAEQPAFTPALTTVG